MLGVCGKQETSFLLLQPDVFLHSLVIVVTLYSFTDDERQCRGFNDVKSASQWNLTYCILTNT